jgi:hypothetical protein
MDNFWVAAFWSIIPTIVVLGLFLFILRAVVHMDRNERRVYAKIEAEERARRGLPPALTPDATGSGQAPSAAGR